MVVETGSAMIVRAQDAEYFLCGGSIRWLVGCTTILLCAGQPPGLASYKSINESFNRQTPAHPRATVHSPNPAENDIPIMCFHPTNTPILVAKLGYKHPLNLVSCMAYSASTVAIDTAGQISSGRPPREITPFSDFV